MCNTHTKKKKINWELADVRGTYVHWTDNSVYTEITHPSKINYDLEQTFTNIIWFW